MPTEPSNPRLQRTALRATAEPPSRYLLDQFTLELYLTSVLLPMLDER